MTVSIDLGQLAEQIGACLEGVAGDLRISGVASLHKANATEISFFTNRQYRLALQHTQAAAVILKAADRALCSRPVLLMDNPYLGYARVARLLNPPLKLSGMIHPSAVIAEGVALPADVVIGPQVILESGVQIGSGSVIGAGCIIQRNVRIGNDCHLTARVTLAADTQLGDRVIIQPGAVLGSDGFGLANDNGKWLKIPQLGKVIVGDDVEIGANTTIDRGALEDTLLGTGVKLDNQIQIAHNVQIGDHTAIAGCVGIAGSTHIGQHCMIAGGVGIVGHIEITDNVYVTGGSIVLQSITQPGVYSSGTPLQLNQAWHRNYHRFKQLDEFAKRLHTLEQEQQ